MQIHISIPFELLKERYLEIIIERKIAVEISLKAEILDSLERKVFKEVADILEKENVDRTVHLPFMDLSLAGFDPWIREVSLKRLFQGMERASLFSPKLCVFHSGYHPDYHREERTAWRDIFIEFSLPRILERAKDLNLRLALENTFEPDPEFLQPVFTSFKEELFWCFDPGHARVFSEKDELIWLQTLHNFLGEIHCHDNNGSWDEHLALGRGIVKFEAIFDFVLKAGLNPIITIEAKKEEDALISLKYLENLFVKKHA